MDFKDINPLWRLADPLTMQQAAVLIAGFDPNAVRFNSNDEAWFESETGFTDSSGISWVKTAFAALMNAINARKLKATIRRAAEVAGVAGFDPAGFERAFAAVFDFIVYRILCDVKYILRYTIRCYYQTVT